MKKRLILIGTLCVSALVAGNAATTGRDGAQVPNDQTAIGGKGSDGLFHVFATDTTGQIMTGSSVNLAKATISADAGTKTASFTGATQTNPYNSGAIVTVRLGTVSGTSPTLAVQMQYSPDDGTTWITLGGASTNVTATGNTITFVVYPGASGAATGATATVTTNSPLPRTWRLNYTIGGTTPSFAITEVDINYCL